MSVTPNHRPTRKNRRKTAWILIPFSLIILLCLITGALAFGYQRIETSVLAEFGEPQGGLTRQQILGYTFKLYFSRDDLLKPARPEGLPTLFTVQMDESISSIADRLESSGIIPDADVFITYLAYSGLDSSIQAGSYEFGPLDTPLRIALQMQDATPKEITFAMLAGWRMEEAAEALVVYGLLDETGVFLELASHPDGLVLPEGWPDDRGVEGLLFPGEYSIPRESSAGEILSIFLNRFSDEVGPALKVRFEAQGLSLHQAVTLASIVEKEAVRAEEQPMIASVFINRLENGMNLETDPTVQYAIGFIENLKTWWKNPLSAADLEVNHPYNTYKNNGLPPGPICSPGLSAMNAVANPPAGNYFFFRARCDGSGYHNFSQTFEEHLNYACN